MNGPLHGKTVILTGGAGGQGKVAARLIVEAGANLVLTDRDPSGAVIAEAIGSQAIFVSHDVTDESAWSRVVTIACERFGGVDALIHYAAIAGRDSVQTLSPQRLRQYFDVNVIGALNGIHAVLPAMRARGRGSIVHIGSIAALRSTPGIVGYGTSKWALRGLTRNAAVELATDNVRVNLLLPGVVEVSMIKDATIETEKSTSADGVPMKRSARCEEIANAAIFLASDAASYITGAELTADGGWCA